MDQGFSALLNKQLLVTAPIFFYTFIYLFYLWLCCVFFAARRLSLVVESGVYSLLWYVASYCSGFSCCGARALGTQASVVVARGLRSEERRVGKECRSRWSPYH